MKKQKKFILETVKHNCSKIKKLVGIWEEKDTEMYCRRCGNKLSDADKFCPKCGMSVQEPDLSTDNAMIQSKGLTHTNSYSIRAKAIIALIVGISIIIIGIGLLRSSAQLEGTWIPPTGAAPSGYPDMLILFKDGTGYGDGMSVQWYCKGNQIIVKYSSFFGSSTDTYYYKVTKNKLTLCDVNDGPEDVVIYNRKK